MSRRAKRVEEKEELPASWQQIQSAIWLIGLAIIAWRGWWWPGILVLVAISGLVQAAIRLYLNQAEEQKTLEQVRSTGLPENCPRCGGPLDAAKVQWTSATTAICPYCGSPLKATSVTQTNVST